MSVLFKRAQVNSGSVPGTLTNFPAYVDLSRIGITTLAQAQSVRVYTDSSVELAREIVSASEMYVKIPSLTSTASINVYADGVAADYAAGDTYGRNNVWTGYVCVMHLTDTTDSTGVSTPTATSATPGTGLIGGAYDFAGSGHRILINTDTNLFGANPSTISVTALAKNDTLSGSDYLWSSYDSGATDNTHLGQRTIGTTSLFSEARSGGTDTTISETVAITTGTWRHYGYVFNKNTTIRGYLDGANSSNANSNSTGDYTDGGNVFIGTIRAGGSYVDGWDGLIDEIRFATTELSANWMVTESDNLLDEATFWGTWTDLVNTSFIPKAMII